LLDPAKSAPEPKPKLEPGLDARPADNGERVAWVAVGFPFPVPCIPTGVFEFANFPAISVVIPVFIVPVVFDVVVVPEVVPVLVVVVVVVAVVACTPPNWALWPEETWWPEREAADIDVDIMVGGTTAGGYTARNDCIDWIAKFQQPVDRYGADPFLVNDTVVGSWALQARQQDDERL
jgi:hypothetical protein